MEADGSYISPPREKLGYATMVFVRYSGDKKVKHSFRLFIYFDKNIVFIPECHVNAMKDDITVFPILNEILYKGN